MEVAEPIVGRRRVRQFRTTQEKRFIVEETRKTGVSVATVAQAHGVNANQVFYWRKLYEAGQLESTPGLAPRDLGAACVRLLPVSVDEGADRQDPVMVVGSAAEHTAGSDALPGSIELTLARGQVRIAGTVDAGIRHRASDKRPESSFNLFRGSGWIAQLFRERRDNPACCRG